MRVFPVLTLLVAACASNPPPHPIALQESAKCAYDAREGNLESAEQSGHLALEYSPTFHEPHNCLAIIYYRQGKDDLARTHWRRAITLNNDFVEAYTSYGSFLADKGELTAAARMFEQALAIDPGTSAARLNLAKVLVRQKKLAEARKHLIRCTSLDETAAACWFGLGEVAVAQGFVAEGERFFSKQVESAPNDATAWHNLCRARLMQQKCAEAKDACSAALSLDQTSKEAHETLAAAARCHAEQQAAVERKAAEMDATSRSR